MKEWEKLWVLYVMYKWLWIREEVELENGELSILCMLGDECVVLEIEGKGWMWKIVVGKL